MFDSFTLLYVWILNWPNRQETGLYVYKHINIEILKQTCAILADGQRQSEHIGKWATPHHLSDVRRGAPSWLCDYLAHSDVTVYV